MHCPKCNSDLGRDSDGTLVCQPGRMPMSQRLSDGLTECFERSERHPSEEPTTMASGEWFCPACGVEMITTPGVEVRCPSCGRWPNEFLFDLIELHSHA